jgi:hypothetical protein
VSRAIRFVVLANGKLYCTGLMIVGRSEVEAGDGPVQKSVVIVERPYPSAFDHKASL